MITPQTTRRIATRATLGAAALTSFFVLSAPSALAATEAPGAKGAPIGDVIIATAVATLGAAIVLWIGLGYRAGRMRWLRRISDDAARVSGLPGWAAVPGAVAGVSLITAVFGYYWDVGKHIDTGRDSGPFGTAAHYPILAGLGGMVLAGFLAIVLAEGKTPTSIRIRKDWHAPLGGVLMFVCGAFAASGFPLDDVWHTLFGQDVTLWGPTHVLMIGGASLVVLGLWTLLIEGRRAAKATGADMPTGLPPAPVWLQRRIDRVGLARAAQGRLDRLPIAKWIDQGQTIAMAGAFLIAMSTLQAEFDFGVPQFQFVFHPIMIMLAASVALVTARLRVGRGAALGAVAFFLGMRGLLTLIVGPVLGESTQHFPLYVAEALIVELVGLRFGRRRPLALGLISGALIGTVGLAAEWGWSHVWMPLPWPSTLLAQAAVLGFAVALAGGVLGAFIGCALSDEEPRRAPAPGWALGTAGAVIVACIAFPMPMTSGGPVSASATLTQVAPPPNRTVNATFRLSPASAAHGAQWVQAIAWQGGGLKVDRLHRVAPGVYRTTQPLPVYGNWKTVLRLENGRGLRSVPIYLPEDRAIPAAGVAATPTFTREFVRDKKLLQREAVGGSAWLTVPAYLILLTIVVVWLGILGWGLRRLQVGREEPAERRSGAAAAVGPPRVA